MKLVIIFGPHAVGKMTVGQELERLSDLRLFHNHQPIELVLPYFSYGASEGRRLVNQIRDAFFDAFVASDAPGYILTFVWAFDVDGEADYMERIADRFRAVKAEIYWIELEAPLEERLKRNVTENRLHHKPSKRDLVFSEAHVKRHHQEHRLNSLPGEIPDGHYLRIDTSNRAAQDVAREILDFLTAHPGPPA
ncbi:MAG: AAA family ATPase [Pseudomonadota bacterium]